MVGEGSWHRACKRFPGTWHGGTTMRSLALRWTFAILIGTAWNAIEPIILGP